MNARRGRASAWVATILLVTSAPSTLPAQTGAAARRAVRSSLRDVDETPMSGRRLVAAIEQLGKFDDKASATALLDAATKIEGLLTPIRGKRRAALLAAGGSGRLKRSRYQLRNLDDAAEAIATALAQLREPAAVRAMLRRLTNRGNALPLWLRLQLAARAGELPLAQLDWRPQSSKNAANDTVLALLAVTAALGPRAGATGSGAWVGEQLTHDNADVRIAAARTLAQLGWADGIELLIARIDDEQGVVRERVLDALVVLTSAHPGDSAASWRAWLAAEGKPLLTGKLPLARGDAKMRRRSATDKTVSGTYFGIAQTGQSILYVFDNSQSMKQKLGGGPKGKAPPTGATPRTRWQLCRRELKSALRALPASKRFNLVAFANKVRSFEPGMRLATKANVERAVQWLDALQLEFQTNVFDALELAFAHAGRGADDRYYATDVDTIFFLSDGAPTIPNQGRPGIGQDDPDRILAAVRRWNALDRITVHAVGIGLQQRRRERNDKGRLLPPMFLRFLAEQNGGLYQTARR